MLGPPQTYEFIVFWHQDIMIEKGMAVFYEGLLFVVDQEVGVLESGTSSSLKLH